MDLMEMDDGMLMKRNLIMEDLGTRDLQRRKAPSRCISVCLGLLCAVLLAGNIGQFVYYNSHPRNCIDMQDSYEHLQREKAELQSNFSSMRSDRDELQIHNTNVTLSKNQLQNRYNSLMTDKEALENSYDALKREQEQLQTNHSSLETDREELEKTIDKVRNDLTKEKDQLQQSYNTLTQERDQLQTNMQRNYDNLQREKNELQTNFTMMRTNRDELQRNYSSMMSEKDQLQTSKEALQREKEQLVKKINTLNARPCETGWKKFRDRCYYASTRRTTWSLSRDYCITKGADLVIINSSEKRDFVSRLVTAGVNTWIGLTDRVGEGTWMWVDGTPVNTTYWEAGQPNSHGGDQDCGEMVQKGEWNDEGCSNENKWICEK
ncbi:C-type lectin domain family 4 member G-like [Notolabrus celidotus]|uniref:C-type lectin domain family 4 member G-like n=1 Tax=Notolabrus celidotus TaxID=1203425 RepID=UPI001490667C|nr:C-type lectin domain family 4 member G-like [Notolabrus celidotus]